MYVCMCVRAGTLPSIVIPSSASLLATSIRGKAAITSADVDLGFSWWSAVTRTFRCPSKAFLFLRLRLRAFLLYLLLLAEMLRTILTRDHTEGELSGLSPESGGEGGAI